MHEFVFYFVVVWQMLLAAILTVYALRTRHIVNRILALEVLALVFVGTVASAAYYRQEAGYLDVALVLALLGFVQTVAVCRLAELRKEFR